MTLFKFTLIASLMVMVFVACGIATKKDIWALRHEINDVQGETRQDVAQQQRMTAELVRKLPDEHRSLAGMVHGIPLWGWFTGEFLLFGGYAFAVGIRLRNKPLRRLSPLTDEELGSLDLAGDFIDQVVARRTVEPPRPGPDPPGPPDDNPILKVIK